jgi:hypothetical protein
MFKDEENDLSGRKTSGYSSLGSFSAEEYILTLVVKPIFGVVKSEGTV